MAEVAMRFVIACFVLLGIGSSSVAQTITVNGGTSPIEVFRGDSVTIQTNRGVGTATDRDWVGIAPVGSSDCAIVTYWFLSGSAAQLPPTPLSTATFQVQLTVAPGTYEFRYFENQTCVRLATSGTVTMKPMLVTVNGIAPPNAAIARANSAVEFKVRGGYGHPSDWVATYPVGAANYPRPSDWSFLSGTWSPGEPLYNATLQMNVPAAAGNYEVRLFPAGEWTPIATVPIVATPAPELLIQPTMFNRSPTDQSNSTELREACLNQSSWPTARARSKFFGNAIWVWEKWTDAAEVTSCLNNLHAAGISLVIEAPSLRWFCAAQACWEAHRPQIERLISLKPAGMKVFLVVDEPLTWGGGSESAPGPAPYTVAVNETVEYIRLARSHTVTGFSDIGIFLAEAFPTHTVSTLNSFFADVHNGTIAATGKGIDYAVIDHDWNDAPHGETGILLVATIGSYVQSLGIKAAVAFWNASPNLPWHSGLMAQGSQYRLYGWYGSEAWEPDLYFVSNWTGDPLPQTHEWSTGTYMRSLRDFVNTYIPTPTSVHGLRPREFLSVGSQRLSPDGRFALTYQTDGNLVLTGPNGHIWDTGTVATSGRAPTRVTLESSGNLVVFHQNSSTGLEEAVWMSNTLSFPGAYLVVQSDGNLVMYYGRTPIWETNTDSW